MRVKIDRDLCTGVGNCAVLAPTVFVLDEENKAVVLDSSSVEEGVLCGRLPKAVPLDAIIIEDDEGEQLYP